MNSSSAGVSPAVAGASRPRFGAVTIRNRGRLPHWEMECGRYFITFRLADSLPQRLLRKWRGEVSRGEPRPDGNPQLVKRIEEYLDRGFGACYLKNEAVASVVSGAIHYLDGKDYRLIAWVIMPNHAHLVVRLLPGKRLEQVLHSLKSFSAKQANEILGRRGVFWQREYYDRLIRNAGELDRAVRYVVRNPVKAGLVGWKWVEECGPEAHTTAGEDAGATATE